jgi:formylglycine-generating enzyme required for sulfatase activity
MNRGVGFAAISVTLGAALVLARSSPAERPKAEGTPAKLATRTIKIDAQRFFDTKFEMAWIPPGKVTIKGGDGRDRTYDVKPIWMGVHEVQWAEYDVFWQKLDVPDNQRRGLIDAKSRPSAPYEPPDGGYGHDGYPAGRVNYVAAEQYVAWLSKHTGKKFRLPTEAEWEHACRAGGGQVAPRSEDLEAVAWFAGNSEDKPHAVGRKRPNAWGLYDMLGNVAEFVTIDPDDRAKVAKNGRYFAAGGSFMDESEDVHPGAREPYHPRWQRSDPQDPKGQGWLSDAPHVGLRVVLEE